jgi:4-hydroxy-tetrahydrodipicolinate reductase
MGFFKENFMKIGLIGYGKTGKMVEKYAQIRGHEIVGIATSKDSLDTLQEADVCIDFSHPEATLKNIKHLANLGKNVVIGTTGWYDALEAVDDLVKKSNIGLLYGPNFSIGVQLFNKILFDAAKLLKNHSQYDIAAVEEHHNQKVDAPSGTALKLSKTILDASGKKIAFSTIRCGSIPGTHTIIFDSPADTLTLSHQARNREGFAEGAVIAAEWLLGKKGIYRFEDIFV